MSNKLTLYRLSYLGFVLLAGKSNFIVDFDFSKRFFSATNYSQDRPQCVLGPENNCIFENYQLQD